jgi:hypothetical protein
VNDHRAADVLDDLAQEGAGRVGNRRRKAHVLGAQADDDVDKAGDVLGDMKDKAGDVAEGLEDKLEDVVGEENVKKAKNILNTDVMDLLGGIFKKPGS